MQEFPVSLLEVLLKSNIGDEILIKEIPKLSLTNSLFSIIAPTIHELRRQRDSYESERISLQGKKDRGEIYYGWHGPGDNSVDQRERLMKRLAGLPSKIAHIDEKISDVTTQVKRLENEGFFLPSYHYLPPSIIARRTTLPPVSYGESYIGVFTEFPNVDIQFHPKFYIFQLNSVHILPLTKLLRDPSSYEDKCVVTSGVLIGLGQESHNIEEESHSYTTYTRSSILLDATTGNIIEVDEPNTIPYRPFGIYPTRIIANADQTQVVSVNQSRIYAYLDASKTTHYPVIIGGTVNKDKFVADMFVTNVGNNKQVFAYVIKHRTE